MDLGITIALIVVFVLMLVMPYISQRKSRKEYVEMLSSLKVGDMVKTGGGIIGKINKISDKGEIKTVIIETGSKSNKSYIELDISMIYCILKKSSTKTEDEKTEETEISTEEYKIDASEYKIDANEYEVEAVPAEEKKTTKRKSTTNKKTK